MNQPPTVKCEYCQRVMTRGRWATRRFCSSACRQASYRQRKKDVTQK